MPMSAIAFWKNLEGLSTSTSCRFPGNVPWREAGMNCKYNHILACFILVELSLPHVKWNHKKGLGIIKLIRTLVRGKSKMPQTCRIHAFTCGSFWRAYSNPGQGGFHWAPFVLPPVNDDDETDACSIQAVETRYQRNKVFLAEFNMSAFVVQKCPHATFLWWRSVRVPGDAGQIGSHVEEVLLRHFTETWVLREGDDRRAIFTSPSYRTEHKTSKGYDPCCCCCCCWGHKFIQIRWLTCTCNSKTADGDMKQH